MAKTFTAAHAAHYLERRTTIAHALRITRLDGAVYAYTSYQEDQIVHGVNYLSTPGIDVSQFANAIGYAVGTVALTALDDGTIFTYTDVMSRKWEGANYVMFRYDYENPPQGSPEDDIDIRTAGTIGVVTRNRHTIVAELRDLRQQLQHPAGEGSSKLCRNRLGDSRCGVDLTGSPNDYTAFGWVTTVLGNQMWNDSSRTEAAGWYDDGLVVWLTGNNSGITQTIKSFAYGSPPEPLFTLKRATVAAIQVGDSYTITAGCRKRWSEDCVIKFDNGNRFGGEPHRPFLDDLTVPIIPNV